MSISAPPGHPSIGETLSSSFRDAYALAKVNLVPALLLIVAGSIAAYVMLPPIAAIQASAAPGTQPAMPTGFLVGMCVFDVLVIVLSCYALAAAVRTIHAAYRMTVGQFFGIIGYALLASLLTMLATLCFVIPGYWVFIKLVMTPYTYAVTGGAPGALSTTWNMTTGYYWQTFGMLLCTGLSLAILLDAAVFASMACVTHFAPSLYVFAPIVLAILVWAMHAQALVYVRWTNGLLPRANRPQMAAVPA